jgi:DNA-directed RNA polymerase subunit omega
MILYPMNEMLSQVKSRYELVNLVARRARQITSEEEARESEEGYDPLEEKPVTMALNEAWEGKLPMDEAQQEAQEEPEEQTQE